MLHFFLRALLNIQSYDFFVSNKLHDVYAPLFFRQKLDKRDPEKILEEVWNVFLDGLKKWHAKDRHSDNYGDERVGVLGLLPVFFAFETPLKTITSDPSFFGYLAGRFFDDENESHGTPSCLQYKFARKNGDGYSFGA